MFVNRISELKTLNKEYCSKKFSFTIIYGRRRVGKTALIKKYIEDKDAIYFLVTLESEKVVLQRFVELVANFFNDDFLKDIEIKDLKQLFKYIASKNHNKKLIIVIDEFQYLAKIDSSYPSQFQYIVDEILKDKNIHLILCGSIISMMYEQTLSYNSPLYGRRTSSIKLEPIEFDYIDKFFSNKDKLELIETYAVVGGVPKYLELFENEDNIFDAIKDFILEPNSYLYEEPRFLLLNEVNEPINYFTILESIAFGEHKLGNIANRLGKNVQNITSFISKLIDLDIIYKDVPITEENPLKSKKGLYFIKDNFFRFWFYYVLPNKSMLEIGKTDIVLEKIKQNFSGFVAKIYEDLAIKWTLRNFDLIKCGRWWNRDIEVDIVGVAKDYLIVGECKYSNKKVGVDILDALKEKTKKIDSKLPIKKYLLFSKRGFTNDLLNLAKKCDDVELIDEIS